MIITMNYVINGRNYLMHVDIKKVGSFEDKLQNNFVLFIHSIYIYIYIYMYIYIIILFIY